MKGDRYLRYEMYDELGLGFNFRALQGSIKGIERYLNNKDVLEDYFRVLSYFFDFILNKVHVK